MKHLVLIFVAAMGFACNKSDESLNINLTENGCNRQGSFSSQAAMCEFLKKEMESHCVPTLAAQNYEQKCLSK